MRKCVNKYDLRPLVFLFFSPLFFFFLPFLSFLLFSLTIFNGELFFSVLEQFPSNLLPGIVAIAHTFLFVWIMNISKRFIQRGE